MNERFVRARTVAHVDLAREAEFVFGLIRVRPAHCELVGAGWSDMLEPRVKQVLVALARAGGEVVSRDDLIEACWEGRIVGEDSIGRCIARLRKSAETSGHAFSIETVSRVGDRLKISAAAAAGVSDANGSIPLVQDSIPAGGVERPPPVQRFSKVWRSRSVAAVTAGVLVLMMMGIGIWSFWPKSVPVSSDPVTSVAVLPFVNMSGDPAKEYFSDGFSEELVNDLSNVPNLRVASRTSSFGFKGKNGDIQSIARALHVHAVVEGSVRESGDRIRITAQLIDAGDGYHLWSGDYTRDLTDILSVQDELARAIATQLTHRLVPRPATSRPRIDPAVYRLYLEGRHQFDRYTPESLARSVALLKQVTLRQPNFADGFALLSLAAGDAAGTQLVPSYGVAYQAARSALSLDPHNVTARVTLAGLDYISSNWTGYRSDVRVLRAESPNALYTLRALRDYYATMGFPEQAIIFGYRALKADAPDNDYRGGKVANLLSYEGRFRESIGLTRAILARQPNYAPGLGLLCRNYAFTGRATEALEIKKNLLFGGLNTDLALCDWGIDMAKHDRAAALRLLQTWQSGFPDGAVRLGANDIGWGYLILGDFDKATDWFERAYERHEPDLYRDFYTGLGVWDAAQPVHSYRLTPAYKALAAKPLFKAWQAEHDRIAAELAARGGAP